MIAYPKNIILSSMFEDTHLRPSEIEREGKPLSEIQEKINKIAETHILISPAESTFEYLKLTKVLYPVGLDQLFYKYNDQSKMVRYKVSLYDLITRVLREPMTK